MEALLSKDAGELEKDVIVPYDKLVTSKIITQSKNAEEYSIVGEWNILLYLYSIIAADEPIWVTTKTYNNIAIDYTDYYTYKPFKTLIL